MAEAGDWQKPVECLYCEAPLKNFRGLFDEDFCSREHREKYLASFRKALTQLPDTKSPVAPEPLFPQPPPPPASSQETVQSVVRAAPRAPEVQTVTVSYLAAEPTPEAPLPSVAAAAPADPAAADFVQTPLAGASVSSPPCAIPNSAFAACNALSTPGTQSAWSAALEPESGMADFVEAIPTPSAATPWADTFLFHLSPARFSPAEAAHPVSLQPVEVAYDETQATAEDVTTRQQPAPPISAAIKLVVPFFSVASET
ncbi:MAG: hypothetical protein JWO48_3425 [Bryobacterales bacterium]|nr:hypothetical protein [Bryobacterales bacterium]